MAGSLGVSSIKQLMTTGKLGAISFLQAVSKDGLQVGDVLAPINSPTFKASLEESTMQFKMAMAETSELDLWDNIEIVQHAWVCWKDIATEGKLAIAKIKSGAKVKAA